MKKNKSIIGYSLLEVVITSGLLVIVFSGFSKILEMSVRNQQNLAFADRKQDILVSTVNLLNNDIAWQKTIDRAANSKLDCLKDKAKFPGIPNAGNCLMADGGQFTLVTIDDEIYLDNVDPAAGFSLYSGACNTHSLTGDDSCPLRGEVSWRPLCVSCINPQIEITINIIDRPLNQKRVQAQTITHKIVRYAQPHDPDLILYLKLDGTIGNQYRL